MVCEWMWQPGWWSILETKVGNAGWFDRVARRIISGSCYQKLREQTCVEEHDHPNYSAWHMLTTVPIIIITKTGNSLFLPLFFPEKGQIVSILWVHSNEGSTIRLRQSVYLLGTLLLISPSPLQIENPARQILELHICGEAYEDVTSFTGAHHDWLDSGLC